MADLNHTISMLGNLFDKDKTAGVTHSRNILPVHTSFPHYGIIPTVWISILRNGTTNRVQDIGLPPTDMGSEGNQTSPAYRGSILPSDSWFIGQLHIRISNFLNSRCFNQPIRRDQWYRLQSARPRYTRPQRDHRVIRNRFCGTICDQLWSGVFVRRYVNELYARDAWLDQSHGQAEPWGTNVRERRVLRRITQNSFGRFGG